MGELTLAELLDVWKRSLPSTITEPRIGGARGYELAQAAAHVFRRVHRDLVENGIEKTYILLAPRGRYSQGGMMVSWTGGGTYGLRAGARFRLQDGRVYVTPEDALGLTSPAVIAIRGEHTSADYDCGVAADEGPYLQSLTATYVSGVWTDTSDPPVEVTAPADITAAIDPNSPPTGGSVAILDLLAQDRGVDPLLGETEERLRERSWIWGRAQTEEALEQAGNDAFWAVMPDGVSPPYALVVTRDAADCGAFCWGDEDHCWDDADCIWSAKPPWVAVFIPELPEQSPFVAFDDGDDCWDDATFLWDDVDHPAYVYYQSVIAAVEPLVAKGVGVLFFTGTPPL